jgi:hypothetical protein
VWFTRSATPLAAHAAIMRSASASVVAIGFSQKMPLTPAPQASITICAWRWSGVATLRSSIRSARSISR